MRKVEQVTVACLISGEPCKVGNSSVEPYYGEPSATSRRPVAWDYKLHGHLIARYWPATGKLYISDAGWRTVTTKSRLNAILSKLAPGWGIVQHDFTWHQECPDGHAHEWTGSWIFSGKIVL